MRMWKGRTQAVLTMMDRSFVLAARIMLMSRDAMAERSIDLLGWGVISSELIQMLSAALLGLSG